MIAPVETKPEEIAVIGGGLGGCLTALMLAKSRNPDGSIKYHINLIEAQDQLLNGASTIASRLHLGGEYPLDEKTALDCLRSAIEWKLLMPENIYSPVPPMKFFVSSETQEFGEKEEKKIEQALKAQKPLPKGGKPLTIKKYVEAYEKIRKEYEKIFKRVQLSYGWSEEQTEKALFGSYKEERFFHQFTPEELQVLRKDYGDVAGGFQSPEIGLTVPKYLSMIEDQVRSTENITVMTGKKVRSEGIRGSIGKYNLLFEVSADEKEKSKKKNEFNGIIASQVVQAAWSGGPDIMSHILPTGKKLRVKVMKRAMLLVPLPPKWKTEPAFVMLGQFGGMLSPYNDEMAVCYIPTDECAYVKDHVLTEEKKKLPDSWDTLGLSKPELETRKENYVRALKRRFDALGESWMKDGLLKTLKPEDCKLIIRDTLNFQDNLEERQWQSVQEAEVKAKKSTLTKKPVQTEFSLPPGATVGMGMQMQNSMMQRMEQDQIMERQFQPPQKEEKVGVFTVYPTKATYAVHAALQAKDMVERRSALQEMAAINPSPETEKLITPNEDALSFILGKDPQESKQKKNQFGLLEEIYNAEHRIPADFWQRHPDLPFIIAVRKWMGEAEPSLLPNPPSLWVARQAERKPPKIDLQ